MENRRITEQNRTDELLRMALEDHVLQAEPELKKKDEVQKEGDLHQFSSDFENRFEGMLRKSKNEEKKRRRKHILMRTAACFLLVIGVGAVTIGSVDAFRIPFMSFFLSIGQESAEMVSDSRNNVPVSDDYINLYPTYIPSEYVMISISEYDNGYSVAYQNDQGSMFQLDCYEANDRFSLDAEDSDLQQIDINGFEATTSSKDGRIVITWPTTNYTYILAGDIAKEDAQNILKSIQFY